MFEAAIFHAAAFDGNTVTPFLKRPLSKRPKIGLSLNAGQEYCRMLPQ